METASNLRRVASLGVVAATGSQIGQKQTTVLVSQTKSVEHTTKAFLLPKHVLSTGSSRTVQHTEEVMGTVCPCAGSDTDALPNIEDHITL
eukprot:3530166-Amphidinium_carterae.1